MDEMTVSEKVSYIKGLAEGLKLNTETNEGRLISAIIDVLGDIALTMEDIDNDLADVSDVVSDLEESVMDIEDEVFGEDDNDDDYIDEDDMYEFTCPACGETITVGIDNLADSGRPFRCPNCGEAVEFDFSGIVDDQD